MKYFKSVMPEKEKMNRLERYNTQNSPRQSANVYAFAEAYLCFIVSASAKKYRGN